MRIGALVPLTRPGWTEAGRHLLAGLELAAEDANIELLVRDTAADPQRALAAVDELAALGVDALAGEYHSVVARTIAIRADALGLRFLCSSAVLDALTDEPTDLVARIAPPQSRGWNRYAEFLLNAGHTRVAVAAQPSIYWSAGTQILRNRLTVLDLGLDALADELAAGEATALLVLAGTPEPALSIVNAVRADPRLTGILIGAPAGQPEFWGAAGAGIPFLRYLPRNLTLLGTRVAATLRTRLAADPSFVAFEGYDTIMVLAEAKPWQDIAVEGTRGQITFTRPTGSTIWQWTWPPIEVATL